MLKTLVFVCAAVVNGLNNFKVGFLTTLPAADTAIEVDSYTECGLVSVGVEAGLVINVDCAASTEQYRYVIVQSADTSAESLCIAEVCVKEGGQYAITVVLVQ